MYKFRSFPFLEKKLTTEDLYKKLARHIETELRNIETALGQTQAGHLDVVHVEPNKLQDGDIRYADGTDWNPGSGRGIYFYDSGVPGWVKLG